MCVGLRGLASFQYFFPTGGEGSHPASRRCGHGGGCGGAGWLCAWRWHLVVLTSVKRSPHLMLFVQEELLRLLESGEVDLDDLDLEATTLGPVTATSVGSFQRCVASTLPSGQDEEAEEDEDHMRSCIEPSKGREQDVKVRSAPGKEVPEEDEEAEESSGSSSDWANGEGPDGAVLSLRCPPSVQRGWRTHTYILY